MIQRGMATPEAPRSADAPRPPSFGIHVVLPEHLSKEPLGIVVRTGDGG